MLTAAAINVVKGQRPDANLSAAHARRLLVACDTAERLEASSCCLVAPLRSGRIVHTSTGCGAPGMLCLQDAPRDPALSVPIAGVAVDGERCGEVLATVEQVA